MPICKSCSCRISKLDKDICPFCGEESPLKGVVSQTADITTNISTLKGDVENMILYTAKSKLVMLMLCIFLGIFGAHAFYLKRYKMALVTLTSNLSFIAAFALIFSLTGLMYWWLAIVVPLFISVMIMIVIGLYLYYSPQLVDNNGEFLK